jgi:hypothetical protein
MSTTIHRDSPTVAVSFGTASRGAGAPARFGVRGMLFGVALAGAASCAADETDTGEPCADTACANDDPTDVRDDPYDVATLREHVAYLASEALAGRAPGSDGDALAIDYIASAFAALGAPGDVYTLDFVNSEGVATANVAAVIWGSDPGVADEIVLLVAHHDHLGVDDAGAIYRGANDDASGIAGMLAIADAMSRGAPPRRTVVFLATGSEEVDFDGARAWIASPPADLAIDDTVFAVNLDMIGSYDFEGLVYALDAPAGSPGRAALDLASEVAPDLVIDTAYPSSLSDLDAFCDADVPGLMFYTDDESYHTPDDVPAQLDYAHLAEIAAVAGEVLRTLADDDLGLAANRAAGCVK